MKIQKYNIYTFKDWIHQNIYPERYIFIYIIRYYLIHCHFKKNLKKIRHMFGLWRANLFKWY